ncbi:MAG: dipeptidase, partial [Microbacteriaceae bacterium]
MTEVHDTQPGLAERLSDAVQTGLPRAIADLSSLVRIPSVSWESFDPAHVAASADAVAALLSDLGVFETEQISRARIGTGT